MNGQMSQHHALRLATSGLIHSALESTLVLAFAWSISLDWFWPIAFFVLSVSGSLASWWVIRTSRTLRLKDPSLLLPRYVLDWTLQLSFTLLLPPLTVIFLLALLVRYNQAMIQFSRRQFTLSWLVLGITLSVALCQGRRALTHPGVDTTDIFLLWLFFVLCLFRLTATVRAFSGMREELSHRNEMLNASVTRLRAVSDRERLLEREHLARDLHESLIQEFQGLVVHCQAAADQLQPHLPAKRQLQSVLEQAEQVLNDSHARMLDLQSTHVVASGLPQALADVACDLSRDYTATFRIRVSDDPVPLQDAVADEVFRIGREALINAFQHANATRVDVDLFFDAKAFGLQVTDNGKGISADLIEQGKAGHWGLSIMRDRARRLGGHLEIRSAEASGAVVSLRLPAALAYRPAHVGSTRWWAPLKRRLATALFGSPSIAALEVEPSMAKAR